ncbi:MAG TPA: hypothetical protein VM261_07425 [Kofleriaceae bacterium]|nr:hypothetical protein [Kofleriaceae bacterium]
MTTRLFFACALTCALTVSLLGCGGDDNGGGGDDGDAAIDDDADTTTTDAMDADGIIVGGDGGPWECHVVSCNNHVLQCGDCVDNDGDGEIDSHDRECLGPCDNTEGPALEPDVGGLGANSCQMDCFFDFGTGQGNDNCQWDHRCDPEVPEDICPFDQNRVGSNDCPATQDPLCASFCGPLTPNGCDCFGCCSMANAGPGGVGERYVYIGALDNNNNGTCTFADIADETKCPTCTPVAGCLNTCGTCEVCIGHPPPGPECNPTEQCPTGIQPCGLAGQDECPANAFCISGCCQAAIP